MGGKTREIAISSYFTVELEGKPDIGLIGSFMRVGGLGMEYEYESYLEGGATVPIQFFKGVVPQTLVLEEGTVFEGDLLSKWMDLIGSGVCVKLSGSVTLRSQNGEKLRSWSIRDAYPIKYAGPDLDSMHSEAAVSRIEFRYGGCT